MEVLHDPANNDECARKKAAAAFYYVFANMLMRKTTETEMHSHCVLQQQCNGLREKKKTGAFCNSEHFFILISLVYI